MLHLRDHGLHFAVPHILIRLPSHRRKRVPLGTAVGDLEEAKLTKHRHHPRIQRFEARHFIDSERVGDAPGAGDCSLVSDRGQQVRKDSQLAKHSTRLRCLGWRLVRQKFVLLPLARRLSWRLSVVDAN